MATRSRRLEIIIGGDAKEAVAALNRTERAADGVDKRFGRTKEAAGALSGSLGTLAKGSLVLGGAMAARTLLSNAWEGIERTEAATAQLEAGLKSTGNAANTTVSGMSSLADAMERTTGIQAELIMEGQGLLQTFTNVRNEAGLGNDVFNQATQASLDLSKKGFGSVADASKMLGKALNDPMKGITALSRAGVTFSAEQKATIESLTRTGDMLGAQKVILAEVEKQVGGAAAAYGETLPGKVDRANAALGQITETVLASAAPALEATAEGVLSLAVNLGLLDSVDIGLPDKLLELEGSSLSALEGWETLAKGLRDNDIWEFGLGIGEGTKRVAELDYGLQQLVSNGNAGQAARLFEEARREIVASGGNMADVHEKFPQYIEAQKQYALSVTKTGDAEKDAAIDTEAWAVELEGLDTEVSGLSISFDYLLGRFLGTEEAEIRLREQTRNLAEAVAGGRRENETAAEFQDRLTSMLIGTTNAANTTYDSMVRSGEAAGTSAERNRFLEDVLNDLANQFPGLRGQIDGYIGKLDSIPEDQNTTLNVDTAQAEERIARLHRSINSIADRGGTIAGIEFKGRAGGGAVPRFAAGGTMGRSGPALVGEEGPELVWLPGGAVVDPMAKATIAHKGGVAPWWGSLPDLATAESPAVAQVCESASSREAAQAIVALTHAVTALASSLARPDVTVNTRSTSDAWEIAREVAWRTG